MQPLPSAEASQYIISPLRRSNRQTNPGRVSEAIMKAGGAMSVWVCAGWLSHTMAVAMTAAAATMAVL